MIPYNRENGIKEDQLNTSFSGKITKIICNLVAHNNKLRKKNEDLSSTVCGGLIFSTSNAHINYTFDLPKQSTKSS